MFRRRIPEDSDFEMVGLRIVLWVRRMSQSFRRQLKEEEEGWDWLLEVGCIMHSIMKTIR